MYITVPLDSIISVVAHSNKIYLFILREARQNIVLYTTPFISFPLGSWSMRKWWSKIFFHKTHNQILTPTVTHIHIYYVCHFVKQGKYHAQNSYSYQRRQINPTTLHKFLFPIASKRKNCWEVSSSLFLLLFSSNICFSVLFKKEKREK